VRSGAGSRPSRPPSRGPSRSRSGGGRKKSR
jgi:hypothetical protein